MHSISRPTCPPSTSFTVIVSAMTASLVGQAGPDQRLGSRRRRDRRRAGSDRLSTSSQPQRSRPTTPPTSAVRGWPHWWCVLDLADFFEGDASAGDLGEDGFCGRCPHVWSWGVVV